MKKSDVLKKKKLLKERRRDNRVRKTHNYIAKTEKGVSQFYIDQQRLNNEVQEAEQRKTMKEIANKMGLNPKEKL